MHTIYRQILITDSGSNQFERVLAIAGQSEPLTGPTVRFSPGHEPWTEPRSGSAGFTFKPRFRPERYHSYPRSVQCVVRVSLPCLPVSSCTTPIYLARSALCSVSPPPAPDCHPMAVDMGQHRIQGLFGISCFDQILTRYIPVPKNHFYMTSSIIQFMIVVHGSSMPVEFKAYSICSNPTERHPATQAMDPQRKQ